MKEMISVAMATYNGAKFIEEQLASVLNQLDDNDEIIISDDGSTDGTLKVVEGFKDNRIKVISGPGKGVKKNFENAIRNCNGKYIFLCDQDDIWCDEKVLAVLSEFKDNYDCKCVIHDCSVYDADCENVVYESFFEFRNSKPGIIRNWYKNAYIGCCMAFDASLKDLILPIPTDIEMHDQWIGIISEIVGKSIFMDEKLIKYRRHENNVSGMSHHSMYNMIRKRVCFIKNMIKVLPKLLRRKLCR